MATLAQLKTRIRLETNKNDIVPGGEAEQALTDAITSAIGYYSQERFWFNRASGTATATPSDGELSLPNGMLIAQQVARNGCNLQKVPLEEIESRTDIGIPKYWAENEGAIRLHSIPDAAYVFDVYGIADLGVPAEDASNAWTTTAVDLIDARSRLYLYRDYWRDPEGAQIAAIAEIDALSVLRRHTRARDRTPLRNPGDMPYLRRTFDITSG